MSTVEAKAPVALELFRDVCDAAGIPVGSERLDLFLALPEPQQERIWRELAARPAETEAKP